jgi:hypothetical protein
MNEEQEFIHDLVNKLTIVYGNVGRIVKKQDTFTKEEMVAKATTATQALEKTFDLINERKSQIR